MGGWVGGWGRTVDDEARDGEGLGQGFGQFGGVEVNV